MKKGSILAVFCVIAWAGRGMAAESPVLQSLKDIAPASALQPGALPEVKGLPANPDVKTGDYSVGSCRISVKAGWTKDSIEIRADKGNQYGLLLLDQKSQKLVAINTCNEPVWGPKDLPMTTSSKMSEGKSTYSAHCGGTFHMIDAEASVTIDDKSSQVTALSVAVKVAKMSYPNGVNSGPIKTTMDQFSCP